MKLSSDMWQILSLPLLAAVLHEAQCDSAIWCNKNYSEYCIIILHYITKYNKCNMYTSVWVSCCKNVQYWPIFKLLLLSHPTGNFAIKWPLNIPPYLKYVAGVVRGIARNLFRKGTIQGNWGQKSSSGVQGLSPGGDLGRSPQKLKIYIC